MSSIMVRNFKGLSHKVLKEKSFLLILKRWCGTNPPIIDIQKLAQNATEIKPPWNVTFFGSDNFSITSLSAVHTYMKERNLVDKIQVVTTRLRKGVSSVEAYCRTHSLPVVRWPVSEALISDSHLGLVVSFGHLIPSRVINKFPLGVLNIHGSLLPQYRGAAPIVHCLLNGDTHTGVTIMRIHPSRFDVGEILSTHSHPIHPHCTNGELCTALASLGAEELLRAVQHLPTCYKNATKQPTEGVSYAPKVNLQCSKVYWSQMDSPTVYRMYLALQDHFPIWTTFKGVHTKLLTPIPLTHTLGTDGRHAYVSESDCRLFPGQIMYSKRDAVLYVGCKGDTYLGFKAVRLKGKKLMSANQFFNGYLNKVKPDERFFE